MWTGKVRERTFPTGCLKGPGHLGLSVNGFRFLSFPNNMFQVSLLGGALKTLRGSSCEVEET